jgi:hypothetical protein
MPHGRPSQALRKDQIDRLEQYRRENGNLGLPRLNRTMGSPFKWRTLQRALEGRPVWDLNYEFIVAWIERMCPPAPELPPDVKMAAAGKDA